MSSFLVVEAVLIFNPPPESAPENDAICVLAVPFITSKREPGFDSPIPTLLLASNSRKPVFPNSRISFALVVILVSPAIQHLVDCYMYL